MKNLFVQNVFDFFEFDPSHNPVFLVEPPEDQSFRKAFVEFLFERYNCPGLYFKNTSSLAALLHSRDNALVIDIGGHSTRVTAILDGLPMPKGIINSILILFVWRRESDPNGSPVHREGEKQCIRLFFCPQTRSDKLQHSHFGKDGRLIRNWPATSKRCASRSAPRAPTTCRLIREFNPVVDNTIYELPDKTNVVIGKEASDIPELLFGGGEVN